MMRKQTRLFFLSICSNLFLLLPITTMDLTLSDITRLFLSRCPEGCSEMESLLRLRHLSYKDMVYFLNSFTESVEQMEAHLLELLCDHSKWLFHYPDVFAHHTTRLTGKHDAQENWFMQKIYIPSHATTIIMGDIRGEVHALLRNLWKLVIQKTLDNNFRLTKDDTYLIFLGNYSNYGLYSLEVWYLLMRLKLANPQQVYLVRGHEETRIATQLAYDKRTISLLHEACKGSDAVGISLSERIMRLYNILPIGLMCIVREIRKTVFMTSFGCPYHPRIPRNCYDPRPFMHQHDAHFETVSSRVAFMCFGVESTYTGNSFIIEWLSRYRDVATKRPSMTNFFAGGAQQAHAPPLIRTSVRTKRSLPGEKDYHEGFCIWQPSHNSITHAIHTIHTAQGYGFFAYNPDDPQTYFCGWDLTDHREDCLDYRLEELARENTLLSP